jgi:hypothetical protein
MDCEIEINNRNQLYNKIINLFFFIALNVPLNENPRTHKQRIQRRFVLNIQRILTTYK